MSTYTQEERLALAVGVQVATIRADQTRGRGALLERRVRPVKEAFERFVTLHGRPPGPDDGAKMATLLEETGGGSASQDDLSAALAVAEEIGRAESAVTSALEALTAAVRDDGAEGLTTLEWLGVDVATYERALDQALGEA